MQASNFMLHSKNEFFLQQECSMSLDWYYKENCNQKSVNSDGESSTALRNEELKACVLAAQAYDQKAFNRLCSAFEPILRKEVFRSGIHGKENLEDAYQQAYKYFLELILSYKGDDFEHLPGLIRLRIHSRLQRSLASLAHINDNEKFFYEDTESEEIAAPDALTPSLDELSLQQKLSMLSAKEATVLQERFLDDLTQEQVAKKMRISSRWVRKLEQKGIEKLNPLILS